MELGKVAPSEAPSKTESQISNGETNDQDELCGSLAKFTQETSFSGLKYVGNVDNHFIRRFIWLLLVLLAMSGLGYQIIKTTNKFINRPTSTKLGYIENDTLEFPSVTFCNTNMFRFDRLEQAYGGYLPLYQVGLNQLRLLFPSLHIVQAAHAQLPETFPGNVSLYRFVVDNAHVKEAAIKSCLFNGKTCGPDNFTTVVTNYGVCYTFNSISTEPPLTVRTPGRSRGLSVVLDAQPDLHVAVPREHSGFTVLLHQRDEVANPHDVGIDLDLGKHTSVRILPREIGRLPKPYGKCVSQHDATLKYMSGSYTKGKCFLECETDYIVEICKCRMYHMSGNSTYCDPHTLVECVYSAYDMLYESKNERCDCPDICKETQYSSSISQSTFPSHSVPILLKYYGDMVTEMRAFTHKLLWNAQYFARVIQLETFVSVHDWFVKLNNTSGVNIKDAFPTEFDWLLQSIQESFYYLQYELAYIVHTYTYSEILEYVYGEVPQTVINVNASFGSEIYLKHKNDLEESFLHSGIYQSYLASGLQHAYNSSWNISFDEFVDDVYKQFNIAEGFDLMFPLMYKNMHKMFFDLGLRIIQETDLLGLTTAFMRANFLHVDIFFGDLEVESIEDQKDYEIFQFICDWGGALGLFFGASLMSFIEALDFFYCDFMKKTKQEEKRKTRQNEKK